MWTAAHTAQNSVFRLSDGFSLFIPTLGCLLPEMSVDCLIIAFLVQTVPLPDNPACRR